MKQGIDLKKTSAREMSEKMAGLENGKETKEHVDSKIAVLERRIDRLEQQGKTQEVKHERLE